VKLVKCGRGVDCLPYHTTLGTVYVGEVVYCCEGLKRGVCSMVACSLQRSGLQHKQQQQQQDLQRGDKLCSTNEPNVNNKLPPQSIQV